MKRLVLITLCVAMTVRASAGGVSRTEKERSEVIALFDVVTSNAHESEGFWGNLECALGEDWYDNRERAVIPLRDALDPKGEHAEMFCDRKARDDRMREAAKALPEKRALTAGSMEFGYPKFNRDFTRATISYSSLALEFYKGARDPFPTGHHGSIHATKKDGKWLPRWDAEGIVD
jgi:hypothetical protein